MKLLTFGTYEKLRMLSEGNHLPNLKPSYEEGLTFGELSEVFGQLKFQDEILESIGRQVDKYNLKDDKENA